jgi:hypothetical protein
MNPSVDDRLNSVLRALQSVVLPALPGNAGLAREQLMLAMGHIQIIQAQRDATPEFEAEELADIQAMAHEILAIGGFSESVMEVRQALVDSLSESCSQPRDRSEAIRSAIDTLLGAAHSAGDTGYYKAIASAILPMGQARAKMDRSWFAPMGFDIELSAAG